MPSAKEIKSSMRGVKDTMKITKAMYMISTIKMRKAKHQLELTEPYFYGLQQAMTKLLRGFPNVRTEFFGDRLDEDGNIIDRKADKPKKVGYIVLSSDRGLAGAYNHNLFNVVEANIAGKTPEEYELFVVGKLGLHTLAGRGYNVREDFQSTVTNPSLDDIRVLAEQFIDLYLSGEFDEFHVIYTRMINAMESDVDMQQLLPFKREDFIRLDYSKIPKHTLDSGALEEDDKEYDGDVAEQTVYPTPEVVMDEIVRNYVTGFLYGTYVEATACEENSRMAAMKSATDNAKDLLKVLTIQYNRVRQAAITQQITEISSGARAMRQKKKQLSDEVKRSND